MSKEFVAYHNLRISTYDVTYIKDLSIENTPNNHAVLKLSAIIDEKLGEQYVHTTNDTTPIDVYYEENNEKKSLFNGVITRVRVALEGNGYVLYVEAKSLSYKMDIKKRSRSFQDIQMTSHELIKEIMKTYTDASYIMNIPNEPIGEFVMQYKETDWEFLRRFISRYHEGIFNEIQTQKMALFIGIPNSLQKLPQHNVKYKIRKNLLKYNDVKANSLKDALDVEYVEYEVIAPQILKLGEHVKYKDKILYINKAAHKIQEEVVKNIYILQAKKGLKQKKIYNANVIGISVEGYIQQVSRDKVKVQMIIDGKQDVGKAYWFPYSTMSASSDGSGWYCMPEVGEKVRVYSPTKNEAECYAISAIGGYSPEKPKAEDRMSNPDNKSLKTAHGKEVKFTPNGILIECDGGQSKIDFNLDGTITVSGEKSIYLSCKENLTIRAEKEMTIRADECIDILCESGSNMIMNQGNEILVTAKKIHNNG